MESCWVVNSVNYNAYCLTNAILAVIAVWIVTKYLGILFGRRKHSMKLTLLWVAYFVFQITVQFHKGNATLWTTMISILLVFMIAAIGYLGAGKTKFFYVLLLHVIWSLIEMVLYFCIYNFPINKSEVQIIGSVLSKSLTIILIYIVEVFWKGKNNDNISMVYYCMLLLVPVGSIYIAVNEFFEYGEIITTVVTFIILLLMNVLIFEICLKLSEENYIENEKNVYAQLVNIMAKNTEEQKRVMEEFYEEKHDLVNQLIVLKDSMEHCNKERTIENLNTIIKSYGKSERRIHSGNNTVDAILNFKYAAAKERGIDFEFKIFIPEVLPIDQCDLGIVLGNAMDNAIEATGECKNQKKIIQVTMGVKKEALVLVIKNPYENTIKRDAMGRLLSTKRESKTHGYGVNSIKRVVNQYQGEVLIEAQDHIFTLTVIMNFREI